ncbi:MAG: metallophosphoesterase [Elusimicrobiota bacterium]
MIAAALLPLLLAGAAHGEARPPSRGPYFVAASSTAARVCWRSGPAREGDACRRIEGLAPGATFSYTIDDSTAAWTAKALPADGADLRFAVFGDIGSGDPAQHSVAAVLERWEPELVLITGDVVYPKGKDQSYDAKYFLPYGGLLTRTPFFPALGNHDYGNTSEREKGEKRFRKHYRPIHHRPRYYSFDAGGAHFISLDDNREGYGVKAAASLAPGSEQRQWLERDLAAAQARWKIVFLHVPLYTSRPHGNHGRLRDELEPLLVQHGVDVVFSGHNHHYERHQPIKEITHITAGMGGAGLYEVAEQGPQSVKFLKDFGFVGITLTRDQLTLEMIDRHGRVRDRHVIEKKH